MHRFCHLLTLTQKFLAPPPARKALRYSWRKSSLTIAAVFCPKMPRHWSSLSTTAISWTCDIWIYHKMLSGSFWLWCFMLLLKSGSSPGIGYNKYSPEFVLPSTYYTLCSKKREATKLLAITLSNLNRFSKFFHCWKQEEISKKSHNIYHHTLSMFSHYLGKVNCSNLSLIHIWRCRRRG